MTDRLVRLVSRLIPMIAVVVVAAACSDSAANSESSLPVIDNELVEAVGIWELSNTAPDNNYVYVRPVRVGDEIYAAVVSPVVGSDATNCEYGPYDQISNHVSLQMFGSKSFTEVARFDLIDQWASEAGFHDITDDGVPDLVISGGTRCSSVVGISKVNGSWVKLPATEATELKNGVLIASFSDYQPDRAAGGVIINSFKWNGATFAPAGPVDSLGKRVNLEVRQSCSKYKIKLTLPLKMCDSGPLVHQFINLAKNVIGDYEDISLVTSENRFTPELARWVKTYRYRHASKFEPVLSVTPEINGKMFEALGLYWNPAENQKTLFSAYSVTDMECTETEDIYGCQRTQYLFPNERCSSYRSSAKQVFPLKMCDFGIWVRWVLDAVSRFDKVSSDALPPVFDFALQERVKVYQRANQLEVDGLVGPSTWRSMFDIETCYDGDFGGNGDGICGPGDNPPD